MGIAAMATRLTEYRLKQTTNPAHQAQLYSALGWRLSNAGQHQDAVETTERAVVLYRWLAEDNPATEPDFAMSLNNWAIDLANVGRLEPAAAASAQAVEICRRLAARRPETVDFLATALSNLAEHLSLLGRQNEAQAAAEETVEICRREVERCQARLTAAEGRLQQLRD